MVERGRVELYEAPAEPKTRAEILLPERYTRYAPSDQGETENFLLGDSGINDTKRSDFLKIFERKYINKMNFLRILIFGREREGVWMAQARHIFVDGSFKIAPSLFSQIFAVLAKRGDSNFVVPIAFGLLPDKTKASYKKFFDMLKV
jgi:hypothetical protein